MRQRFEFSQLIIQIGRDGRRRIARASGGQYPPDKSGPISSVEKVEDWTLHLSEQTLEPTDERYAEKVIRDPSRFDAIEVHCIGEFSDSDGSHYEESDCGRHSPSGFSVFAHSKSGGVECCGDFTLRSCALDYGNELARTYQWQLFDFSPQTSKNNPDRTRREALLAMTPTLKEGFYRALEPLDPDSEVDRPAIISILQVCRAGLIEIWRQLEASEDFAQPRLEASNRK